jgi:ribokinase
MTVVVVGSLNEDLVLAVERIPSPGETVPGRYVGRVCGGKGANQAVAAARAGAATRMVGCVGEDDAGARLLRALVDEGIDVSRVARVDGPSGLAVVSVADDGENAIVVAQGANRHCTPHLVRSALADLSARDVVVAQGEVPVEAVEAAAAAARSAAATFVLNLAPVIAVDRARTPVDVLVVNEHEAAALAGASGSASEDAFGHAAHLARTWDTAAIVTRGRAGALCATSGEVEPVAAFEPERVVDTTGAGDAFVGALAAALELGTSLRTATRWGLAAGAVAVAAEGAQGGRATRERIGELVGDGG